MKKARPKSHGRRLLTRGKRFPVDTGWRVDLTYRLIPEFATIDREVIFPAAATVLGGKGYSGWSGAGFGDRDHGWTVKDRSTAMRLARTLKIATTGLLAARHGIAAHVPIPSPRITVTAPPKVVLDVAVPKNAPKGSTTWSRDRRPGTATRFRTRIPGRVPKSAALGASRKRPQKATDGIR
jgi:hypothetical protein